MDYTFDIFGNILKEFRNKGYDIMPFIDYHNHLKENQKALILRHDIDRFPKNALQMAHLEADLGIRGTYYFRTVSSVLKPHIIQGVAKLGHEIGYHYEDLSHCGGDFEKAIHEFERNLKILREFYPVKTICMHGSPLSKWDNKEIWSHYDYREYGIIADTSLDIDYSKVFYITDNGRGWNRFHVSVRDKVVSPFNIGIRNSSHFIELICKEALPKQIMLNAHPDTFFDFGIKWALNFLFIESKNFIKWIIIKLKLIK